MKHSFKTLSTVSFCATLAALGLWACSDDSTALLPDEPDGAATDDAGPSPVVDASDSEDATVPRGDDAGTVIGGLRITTTAERQELDLFGVPGHRFWLEISEKQQEQMNTSNGYSEDIYFPGSNKTYADPVVIQDAETGSAADYGKIQVRLVGESSARTLDAAHIPNFRIDSNEFQPGHYIGGFEHIRLNNAQVGSIFREHMTHRLFRALGYPALRSNYAWVGTNVWGEDTWVPMTLIEVYKRRFCADNQELLGGDCVNMWEFAGDIAGGGGFPGGPIDFLAGDVIVDPGPIPNPGAGLPPDACQINECDNTRIDELSQLLSYTYRGPGFKVALEDYVDWDRFHEFQCLSWMLWVGDDAIHNSNNNLIIERDDGKFMWAPYSVDISMGQSWYTNVPLTGGSSLASGCQLDPDCWADTIATCEDLIQRFDELQPETLADQTLQTLDELGMLRSGDTERAAELHEWLEWRRGALSDELEYYRYLPDEFGNCPNDLTLCPNNTCGTEEQCEQRCGYDQVWCPSLQSCVFQWDGICPVCPEATPRWCDLQGHQQCVESTEACHALCEQTEGEIYCEAYQQCLPALDCNFGGFPDGGFPPPPPLDGGAGDGG